jgi:hypothetical protein
MIILGEKGLSGYVKKLLFLILVGGSLIILSLPLSLKWYIGEFRNNNSENYYFLLGLLYYSGIFCLWIVFEMNKIFKTLNRKNPFMMDNVVSLKKMSIAAFAIAVAYIIKIVFYNSFLTIIITMVFIIAGLFLIILAEVFKQAVEFKEENDLTI